MSRRRLPRSTVRLCRASTQEARLKKLCGAKETSLPRAATCLPAGSLLCFLSKGACAWTEKEKENWPFDRLDPLTLSGILSICNVPLHFLGLARRCWNAGRAESSWADATRESCSWQVGMPWKTPQEGSRIELH